MIAKDYLVMSVKNLRRRRLRSWLTIIGIIIGVAAIVALISLGQGLEDAINEQFEKLGTDKIMVWTGGMFGMAPGSKAALLDEDDMRTVREIKEIDIVGGMIYKLARVTHSKQTKYTFVSGMPTDETREVLEVGLTYEIADGRDLAKNERGTAIIGNILANGVFFDKKMKVREWFQIEDMAFKVVGVLGVIGNRADDTSIIIPLEDAKIVLKQTEGYDLLIAKVKKGSDASAAAEKVKEKLRRSRDVKKGEEDFTVQTSEQIMESFGIVMGVVQAVMLGIAAISLLVGGIGIMNTMYTAVLERTNEIGVMKAVGARKSDILQIFLLESGLIGIVGGLIGAAFGFGIAKSIEYVAAAEMGTALLRAHVSPELVLGVMLFAFLVGAVSGVLPALQAARLHAVDALAYE